MAKGNKKRSRTASVKEAGGSDVDELEVSKTSGGDEPDREQAAFPQAAEVEADEDAAPTTGRGRKRQRAAACAAAAQADVDSTPAPAAAAAEQQAGPGPGPAPGLSALELLPDELLGRVIGLNGVRELARLSLVSRRLRDATAAALRSLEMGALVLRGQRLGLSRYRDLRAAQLRWCSQRAEAGALRLAPGGSRALELDLWRPPGCRFSAGDARVHFSLWSPAEPAKPLLAFASALQGLRRLVAWHGDVVPYAWTDQALPLSQAMTARHAYVGALLAALAPVAGTLEELSVRLQTSRVDHRRGLPRGEEGDAIVAGLRRLTALRSLDLADCIGVSAELLDTLGQALGRLRSLRIAERNHDVHVGDLDHGGREAFSTAIARLCPLLEVFEPCIRSSALYP
eukprot:tig00000383_g24628.t1